MLTDINFLAINRLAKKLGYDIYYQGVLNIWAFRSQEQRAGKFDDTLVIFTIDKEKSTDFTTKELFQITCDPSDISLINTINPLGCAIIKPAQHKSCWEFGYHRNDKAHPALVNRTNPITVIRDLNKDAFLDSVPDMALVAYKAVNKMQNNDVVTKYFNKENKVIFTEHTGVFGINCHRASSWQKLVNVGLYSEGCIVHYDPDRYNKVFVPIITKAANYNKYFTLTLVTEYDYHTI